MNFIKTFAENSEISNTLSLEEVKDICTAIVEHIVSSNLIYCANNSFFFRTNNNIANISDKELYCLIRYMIDKQSRSKVSSHTIKEATERLIHMPEIQIDIDEIRDKNKYKVLLKNGVFNIKTGEFSESPSKNDLFLYKLNFNYIPDCNIEDAHAFIDFTRTSLGESNLTCTLEWLGYITTTLVEARKAVCFIGPEKCGKSVLIDVIENAIGAENTSSVPFSKLSTEQSRIKYQGKILNLSRETSAEPIKDDDAFKSLVAGEKITGRKLYENSKEFVTYTKFTSASNFFPVFKRQDTATLDRILPIYFKDRIEKNIPTDFDLREKLINEKDIIFSVSLDKAVILIKNNFEFSIPERTREILHNKRIEILNVSEFIKENFEIDSESTISSVFLYNLYKKWCESNAIAAEGRNTFYSKVNDYSHNIRRGKINIQDRNLNGFKGLKRKCNYNKNM